MSVCVYLPPCADIGSINTDTMCDWPRSSCRRWPCATAIVTRSLGSLPTVGNAALIAGKLARSPPHPSAGAASVAGREREVLSGHARRAGRPLIKTLPFGHSRILNLRSSVARGRFSITVNGHRGRCSPCLG